ncbi:MAG: hypothetical protein AMXMBFR4_14790 [Candidatus Hydrogenedentota bacterium]
MSHPELDYSTPVVFSLRDRFSLAVLPPIVAFAMKLLFATCRLEIRNRHCHEEAEAQHGRVILAFWHEVLPLAAWRYRRTGYHTLTSYSYDGELVARVIRYLGLDAVRGSSSRGGSDALRRMEEALRHGVTIGLTLDGPRGPRRESKAGAAVLSVRSGVPVVPVGLAVTRCWRMRSWDRMAIPKPFSRIVCAYGNAIYPPPNELQEAVESARQEIENALKRTQEELERELAMPE